jgi:hypothetical protein
MDDSEQFADVDVIVPFHGTQHLGQIRTQMQVSIGVLLHQHGPDHGERGIGHDKEWGGDVRHGKYQTTGEGVFDGEEGVLAGSGPVPTGVLLGEVVEGTGNIGEVGDEPSIEITKANKRAYPLDRGWRLPLVKGGEFRGIHGNVSLLDDHSKVPTSGTAKAHFSSFRYKWLF